MKKIVTRVTTETTANNGQRLEKGYIWIIPLYCFFFSFPFIFLR